MRADDSISVVSTKIKSLFGNVFIKHISKIKFFKQVLKIFFNCFQEKKNSVLRIQIWETVFSPYFL